MRDDYRFNRALACHDSGQHGQAVEVLTELLSENPQDAACHALLAASLLAQKRLVAAEHEVGIALREDPNLPFAHLTRAQILLAKRKINEAIRACDEALRLDSSLVPAYLCKAALLRFNGRQGEAEECLAEAARLAPDDASVVVALGEHHSDIGDHRAALEFATEALRLDAGSEEANVLMGTTQLALGNTEEAEYHAKFAITRNPDSEAALRLFVSIRTRRNWFTGLWWRFNSAMAGLGDVKSAMVLIGGFLIFTFAAQIALDLGHPATGNLLAYGWLAIVAYSWVGIPMYHRALENELKDFSFSPRF